MIKNIMKKTIGLVGGGFHHAYSSTLNKKPTYFEFNKNKIEDITFFIDEAIVPNIKVKCGIKVAWFVENSVFLGNMINDVIKNAKEISESYDLVFSCDKRIYDLGYKNFHFMPTVGYWIENPKIYDKTKNVSMISSNKRMCEGHNFRLKWVEKLNGKVDLYGRGIKTIDKKEEALCDYMYSIAIENTKYTDYWTEKILDCFVTGTIPIYYGSQDIGKHFNTDGIIMLNDNIDISQLTAELFLSKQEAIKDNFERALKYNVIEDIIWEKYLKENFNNMNYCII